MDTPKKIKLMADYECWCLWDMENIDNLDPEKLPISKSLKQSLSLWECEYDATLNRNDPIKSGFKSYESFQTFNTMGNNLFKKLLQELPDSEIFYHPVQKFIEKDRKRGRYL
jgi:hypothetical protein